MSVAFVSGAAALLRARGYDNAATVSRIERTADDIGPKGRDDMTGYGILNDARALGARVAKPGNAPSPSTSTHRPGSSRVAAAGSATAVPSARATSPGSKPSLKLPMVNAIGPLDIRGSNRSAPVAAGAALICLLLVGHALRAMAAARQP